MAIHEVRRSALVTFSPEQMFDLVVDVERYPQFLPWCARAEVLERRERLDAIAAFEEFLQRYPNDPRYTPDVMLRLAELYYE